MTTVITYTRPMGDFDSFFSNGAEVMEKVPSMKDCTDFWAKGTNAELLIYQGRQIVYSCCYTEAYGMLFITSVWDRSGLAYEYSVDYDAIEKSLPVLRVSNAKVGGFYKFCDGWMCVKKVYRISKKYARENNLCYRDRVVTIDSAGLQHDFALPA